MILNLRNFFKFKLNFKITMQVIRIQGRNIFRPYTPVSGVNIKTNSSTIPTVVSIELPIHHYL